ncbi:PEP-CTERM sorting domain-containing protein, partial [Escherichia coli]|uniref:PEP-CTERM sorting domain-containing protein n=1 Tax=Escherichia coli TaxID=562 RepID=UPI003CF7E0A4
QDDMTDRTLAEIFTGHGQTSFQAGALEVYGPNPENISYSGPVSITPIAVPEPQSWVALLAGFGLLCGLVRRQRRPVEA